MARTTVSTALGIALIVLGVLLVLGEFQLQSLLPFAGLALIVLGILVLVKTLPGGLLVGVVALVVGILLLEGFLGLPKDLRQTLDPFLRIINLVAGILLVILGVQRLRGA